MLLKCIRKYKRSISIFLVINFIVEIVYPLKAFSSSTGLLSSGGGTPVSASASSMVDGYTGDFKYSVPLITLPGPNGESVPISVNYHAGIGVNQKASWVGLGWNYNPGEISRQVVNAPDDYNGKLVNDRNINLWKFGALYNNNLLGGLINLAGAPAYSNYKACDTKTSYRSLTKGERDGMIYPSLSATPIQSFDQTANSNYRFHRHTVPHKSLAYDQYYVNGGISGVIKPYYLGKVNIYPNDKYGTDVYLPSANNKKAQFYFENSSRNNIDISTTTSYPNISYTNPGIVNQITNQIHSGTRVRYFTNLEINTNANLYNNTTNSGFIDYKATTNTGTITNRRTEDNSLIGAFQITDPSGMTYHYSLPVYSFDDMSFNWSSTGFYFSSLRHKYASSWKLTAVTGPDYQDANNNYTVDEGDKGYWIGYNYSLWTNDYFWSSLRYGYTSGVSIAKDFVSFMVGGATGNKYSKTTSGSNGHSQSYFLNYIQTSTHTAFFVKSIRKDEQSYDKIKFPNSTTNPKSLLKLDKIVLLRNEDKNLLINTTSLSGSDLDSRFSYTDCPALTDPNFVNITRYNANKLEIDEVALKIIELETNYSLAKKYDCNINNSFNTVIPDYNYIAGNFAAIYGSSIAGINRSYSGSSDEPNSGKLTLKKINFYDLHAQKITPSIDFGYDETNALKNPDFNKDKTDLWGYYKNDYVNSHYVTNISKDDVDAWSLKEINTSLGGQIKIQYESDIYNKEGFAGESAFDKLPCPFANSTNPSVNCNYTTESVNIPHLIFPIKNFSGDNPYNIEFEDADYGPYAYNVNPLCPLPSGYISNFYSIYNFRHTCSHNSVQFNAGNSWYTPDSQQKLIRKGNSSSSACYSIPPATYPSSYSNVLNYSSSKEEFDFITPLCGTNGGNFSSTKFNELGIDYHVLFRSYLYGGGVRVKQIDVVEPFKNDTYSQIFTYGAGYCPVVPKAMALSTSNGPSPYDLNMNTKSLISSSLNSTVGYDNMTQVSINQNGENTGSIVQTYYNDLVSKPLDIVGKAISPTLIYNAYNQPVYAGGCNLGYYPNTDDYTFRYDITINLKSSNNQSCRLGQLTKSAILNSNFQEVSSTLYSYGSKYIQERFNFNTWESDDFSLTRTVTWPSNQQTDVCKQGRFSVIARDWYNYIFSDTYTYNSFLIGTSTTRDGITILENTVSSDPYTGAPTKVRTDDPTQGVFETYTNYAYYNATTYPGFSLKTMNETNRNQLVLPETMKTVKGGKYVISESQQNYTNSYPVRSYNTPSSKYETTTLTKPWYRLNETYSRLLDDDVLTTIVPQSTDYRKTSVGTLYDSENNRIEEAGLNQRKTASKWGYNNHYKLADISNANYNSFAFSGFEDKVNYGATTHFGGEITNGQLGQTTSIEVIATIPYIIKPHTGFSFAKIPFGAQGPKFYTEQFEIGRTYIAKVWVHKTSPANAALNIQLTGTTGSGALSVAKTVIKTDPLNVIVNDWILMSAEVVVPADFNLTNAHSMSVYLTNASGASGNAYFDDLSFHPKDAVITGNVYNDKTGLLVAQLDNENFATLYDYDEAGRIIATYKEYSGGTKKVTSSSYHFAKP